MERALPVAITGMGCICAAGESLEESLASMFRGERNWAAQREFPSGHRFGSAFFPVARAFEEESELRRTAALAIHASRQALDDAGLDAGALSSVRVGACVGAAAGVLYYNRDDALPGTTPDELHARCRRSDPAEAVLAAAGARGVALTMQNACTSGADAIGLGAEWVRAGLCDLVLAGGAEALTFTICAGFHSLGIVSREPCRPFDLGRKGLSLGEGAAFVVLESERSRRRRGARPRAYVHGYGGATDPFHPTAPDPNARGMRAAVERALEESRSGPGGLAFVCAHGTGTESNDAVEGRYLASVFPNRPLSAIKGYTGHAMGAAGALEAVFTAAFLERGVLPASAGFEVEDPGLGAVPVRENTPFVGTRALSVSLGFGGFNSALVLGVEP